MTTTVVDHNSPTEWYFADWEGFVVVSHARLCVFVCVEGGVK